MRIEEHVAGENVLYLEQGARLVRALDDALFTAGSHRGSVGAQFRHCLDFYACFLGGLAGSRVDYGRRRRDVALETSRQLAVEEAERTRRALLELGADQVCRELEVRAEESPRRGAAPRWSRSSVGRELQFLLSHTIHHYALIAALLEARGHDVHGELPGFGVAPSTLSHWKEAGSAVL